MVDLTALRGEEHSFSFILRSGYGEIIVMPHGEAAWNADARIQPALVKVADRLSKERATSAVYSSDLKRAFETAQIIASKCGDLQVITDPDLRERHLDDLQGFVLQEAVELKLDAYLVSLSSRTDQEIPECSRLLPKSSKVFDLLVEAADVSHLNKTGYLETALGGDKTYG